MERLKLRSYVVPTLAFILVFSLFVTSFFMESTGNVEKQNEFVNDSILGNRLPVLNVKETMINPFTYSKVEIGKTYYDYKASEEEQAKSIVKYDDTYMQNSGVDFICEDVFDVVSVLNGEVISVVEDENLGTIVKIQHDNGYLSVYQSLKDVTVKKDDKVTQGQVIGKSSTNKIDEALGNHLHFELYINNQMVNPTEYLNKTINAKEN